MPDKVKVRIDGEVIAATAGQTILQVARANDKYIPALCYMEGLSAVGACRLCVVEVSGVGRLLPACSTPVQEGLAVTTSSPQLQSYRKVALELLFVERNHICAVCVSSGHCELQSLAQEHGVTHVRYPYNHPKLPVDTTHPRFVLDHNRCILCSRCVRTCAEIEGAHVWEIAGRGIGSRLGVGAAAAVGRGHHLHQLRSATRPPPTPPGREGLRGGGDDQEEGRREPPDVDARGPVMGKPRIGTCWLDGCSGCHMSLLDLDEGILGVLEKAEIVFGPLVDAQEWPEGVDVAVIEGAVSSQDDLKLARTARARSKIVVALGDCAVTGNVPSMRNGIPTRRLLERIYVEGATAQPGVPTDGVPPLLKKAEPLHAAIKVDVHVPGCPPKPDAIGHALGELLEGREPDLGSKLRFG